MKPKQLRSQIRRGTLLAIATILALTVLAADAASFKVSKTRPSRRPTSTVVPVPTDIYLRAEAFDQTMPDGTVVRMWGFARDTSFGSLDGAVSSPGPIITVPVNNPSIVIHLDNNLPQPVSIVIPGFVETGGAVPVRNGDGRVRSFTHETAPGNTSPGNYAFTLRPGSYLYESGTHQQVQVQMGLYGGIVQNYAANVAYAGTAAYVSEVNLFFSEIDPALHEAVKNGTYGPGQAMSSTIDYHPRYFLINGEPFRTTGGFDANVSAGAANSRILVRLFNAGLRTLAPTFLGLSLSVIAEDGFLYPYPKQQYALSLPAGKTSDAFITAAAGRYPVFDRRLSLTNDTDADGGYLRYLVVN